MRWGLLEFRGAGAAVEQVRASALWRLAASGDPEGQFQYANYLLVGRGAVQDGAEAARVFRMAADQDQGHHAGALNGYGVCLDFGLGVRRDPVAAEAFYRRAVAQGDREARINLARLAGQR
jgi:TPR repeat protein